MASQTQCTWVWASSGSWWWTGRPGLLPSMGSQRVGDDWATELNWWLFYTVVLVPALQPSESIVCVCIYVCVCVYIHIYTCMRICPPFWISFPFRSPQNQLEFPVALKTINWITFLSFRRLRVDSGNDSFHHLEESTDPHMQIYWVVLLLNELIYKIP